MNPVHPEDNSVRSPFYRVAGKAIIRDNAGRLLAVRDDTGTFELPGGGWEHDEDFETCLRREIKEELGVETKDVGDVQFYYRGRGSRHVMLRIAAEVVLTTHEFMLDQDEVTEARFVDREEFLALDWCDEDREVLQHVDKLWPPVEKNSVNR